MNGREPDGERKCEMKAQGTDYGQKVMGKKEKDHEKMKMLDAGPVVESWRLKMPLKRTQDLTGPGNSLDKV